VCAKVSDAEWPSDREMYDCAGHLFPWVLRKRHFIPKAGRRNLASKFAARIKLSDTESHSDIRSISVVVVRRENYNS
jgi:hypothetical protein